MEDAQENEKHELMLKCAKYFYSSLLLCMAVFLLYWALPQHWKHDKESKMDYLDCQGIGAAVWGVIFLVLAPITFLTYSSQVVVQSKSTALGSVKKIPQPIFPESFGFSPSDVNSTFGVSTSLLRVIKTMFHLLRFVGNVAVATYNFHILPPRNPTERLNQAKHIVTWVEFPVIMLYAIGFLMALLPACAGYQGSGSGLYKSAIGLCKTGGRFSVLQSLPKANPMNALESFSSRARLLGAMLAGAFFLLEMLLVPIAILSVMVKIAQVDFVTEVICWEWTYMDYIRLAGFVNNLTGLIPDINESKIEAIFGYLDANDASKEKAWLQQFCLHVVDQRGLRGAIIIATLTADDVASLLNTRNKNQNEYEMVPAT